MMRSSFIMIISSLLIFIISGCTALKYVPDDERLYDGASVKMEESSPVKKAKRYRSIATAVIRPKPNKKFLRMRPKLWFYYVSGDTSKSKFRSFINRKLGEPPVYMSAVNPSQTIGYINTAMFNNGIFKANTIFEIHEKKKTAKVNYTVFIHKPFEFDSISYPAPVSELDKALIATATDKTLLKKGVPYSLNLIKKERERIDLLLKNEGFFYFRPDYLQFIADTNEVKNTVNLDLKLSSETPEKAKIIYRIGTVTIDQTFSLKQDSLIANKDTIHVRRYVFKGENKIRPRVILRSVFLKNGDIYSKENHNMTLSRLMSMGNFKFITIDFPERDSAGVALLNVNINLTPSPKRTARIEIQGTTKSNDFAGPSLNISYKNRNTFNGAELLNITLNSRLETQFSGRYKGLLSYDINPKVDFYVPRFMIPWRIRQPKSYYIPLTKFSVGYDYLKRVGFYTLSSFDFSFGYKWKENIKTDHELNPLFINYAIVRNKTAEFDSLLQQNALLKNSFEEQFIAGINYSYTFNEQTIPNQRNQFFLQVKPELAGNLLAFISKTFYRKNPDPENPATFIGNEFSQYARISADARDYINFATSEKLVFRLYTGIGLPYGNSKILPYSKQFFSGGPSSVRAFRLNSLGPGSYQPAESEDGNLFFDQGGELKLEANVEYRFGIFKIIKGAVFTDAGNIWLINKNPDIDVEPVRFSKIIDELGIGSGVGLRLDATFFVVRFDVAFPLHKPWLAEGDRWTVENIAFGKSSWRKDNLLFNFAIGYPF